MQFLIRQFNALEASFVDGLELHAEEHSGDIREDERLVFLHHYRFHITHLVVSDEHVNLRADMYELRANLVIHWNDVQAAIRAFHRILSVLRVVVDASVCEQLALVVGISELLRTEHIQLLSA